MCILVSANHLHINVGKTKLFARLIDTMQVLVYQMNVAASGDAAMILPIPEATKQDDAVEFIDLSSYRTFFDDCAKGFRSASVARSMGLKGAFAKGAPTLTVHEVGDYIASWVPSAADFDRLSPVFRIPEILFSAFPRYNKYGFAVFQLKTAKSAAISLGGERLSAMLGPLSDKTYTISPMAFKFQTQTPETLYFPTVHFHGDGLHDQDVFDHMFYWQGMPVLGGGVETTDNFAYAFMNATNPVVSQIIGYNEPIQRFPMMGTRDNKDTWIERVGIGRILSE